MTAIIEQLAVPISALFSIIYAITVANVRGVGSAKPPNRVLHEPRKHFRKLPVKGAGVDLGCDRPNDLGTATRAIAGRAIAVRGTAIIKDAGAVQKIMDQGVDCDHALAGFEPMRSTNRSP